MLKDQNIDYSIYNTPISGRSLSLSLSYTTINFGQTYGEFIGTLDLR